MTYKALDIARYVINYSNEKDYGISNLKLQKVLYFIQAYFLVSGKLCFEDRIEAWDFGPVVPTVYHEYKMFGASDIPSVHSYVELNKENIWKSRVLQFDKEVIGSGDRRRIRRVVDHLSDYSASQLVEITHRQRPWREAYAQGANREITLDAIRGYFNA